MRSCVMFTWRMSPANRFVKAHGSPTAGLFRNSSLLALWFSTLHTANHLEIKVRWSSRSMKSRTFLEQHFKEHLCNNSQKMNDFHGRKRARLRSKKTRCIPCWACLASTLPLCIGQVSRKRSSDFVSRSASEKPVFGTYASPIALMTSGVSRIGWLIGRFVQVDTRQRPVSAMAG